MTDPTPPAADLAVAIAGPGDADSLDAVRAALAAAVLPAFPGRRLLLLHAGSATAEPAAGGRLVDVPIPADPARAVPPPAARAEFLRSVAAEAVALAAPALAIVETELARTHPEALVRLLEPVVAGRADFVAPWYSRPPLEGAIISGIVYPFTRALYGHRVRFPGGGDVACSRRFLQHCLAQKQWEAGGAYVTNLWLAQRALVNGFRPAEAWIGSRHFTTFHEIGELSAVLARVLGTLFQEAERSQARWQKERGSDAVERTGTPEPWDGAVPTVDVTEALAAFRRGEQHLAPVWNRVLPPMTVLEYRRLERGPDSACRIPDDLWARTLYDVLLAYHARSISREHLLPALTPLYLGWFAGFAMGVAGLTEPEVERRIEELCLRFEGEKPYLIGRWRWPDRFNP